MSLFLEISRTLAAVLYLLASAGLVAFGLNAYVMLFLYARGGRGNAAFQSKTEADWRKSTRDQDLPIVTTQIPLYNEYNVAARVINAVAAFDYPAEKHQIQILDDSTDETRELVDGIAATLRENGIWIDVFRREVRHGYKAGALADAMPAAKGDFIAIFDSDFVPAADFLRRMLPHFADPRTAVAQARWTHLNRDHSLLTRAQSIGIDGHFVIEQTARSTNGLFLNFNGSAGIWRREAIEDAGGWTADTLTEDLDLSYRAQLRGWHFEYVPDVQVPAEIPESHTAFKSQQFRWAKGSLQTAIKLLPAVFRSHLPLLTKIEATVHVCHYFAHFLMLLIVLLAYPALGKLHGLFHPALIAVVIVPFILTALGPPIFYLVSQKILYPREWLKRILLMPVLTLIGFGICISNSRAILEAFLGIRSGFVRTPKSGETRVKTYRSHTGLIPFLEILTGLYAAWATFVFALSENFGIVPFLIIYSVGFLWVGSSSLREQLRRS